MLKNNSLIVLIGVILLFNSCIAPSHLYQYDGELVYKGVVIKDHKYSFEIGECYIYADNEVMSNKEIKQFIKKYIDDHSYIVDRGELKHVGIVGYIITDKFLAGGVYVIEDNIIYLTLYKNVYKMEEMFTHELGHAFMDCLSDKQKMEWGLLYLDRLEELGLEYPLGENYWKITKRYKKSFPDRYCLFSIGEYIAEIFMYYCTDSEYLKSSYNKEYTLIQKHIKELRSNEVVNAKKGKVYKYK